MSSFVTWRSGTRRYQGKASVGLRVPDEKGQIQITCRLQQVQQRVKFSIRATASTAALQRRYDSHTIIDSPWPCVDWFGGVCLWTLMAQQVLLAQR